MFVPKTVKELREALATYPDEYEVWIQANTEVFIEATPERFVIEKYPYPESDPPMVLLAGVSLDSLDKLWKAEQ